MAAGAAAVAAAAVAAAVDRTTTHLGVGLGWRHELDMSIARIDGIDFVEVVAENVDPRRLPRSLLDLHASGKPVVPHGVGLSLCGGDPPDRKRLRHLARLAETLDAPLVSEHLAFVRAGGIESGHLLPPARTKDMLDVVCANIELAQATLPVPLAVENVAALLEWPNAEMTEAEFIRRVVERTGVLLLLDVANLYTNERNFGFDAREAIEVLPIEQIAYVHIAGGVERAGLYHDTHAHPVAAAALGLLDHLCARGPVPGVLLEYDRSYPSDTHLGAELDLIRRTLERARV